MMGREVWLNSIGYDKVGDKERSRLIEMKIKETERKEESERMKVKGGTKTLLRKKRFKIR